MAEEYQAEAARTRTWNMREWDKVHVILIADAWQVGLVVQDALRIEEEEDAGAAVDNNKNRETKGHYLQNTNCCGGGPLYYYQHCSAQPQLG